MPQYVSALGSGNTIVQIVGDHNVVDAADGPHLTLTRFVARRRIHEPLDRLSPYTRSTPLFGREAELAGLHAFLQASRPLSVRVLIGGGGSGKTRLALELSEQAAGLGWSAGFVTRQELVRFLGRQNLSAWGWQRPTLIVVDYAAEHAERLRHWLEELADRAQPPDQPLRMLLLERDASMDTGWWKAVFQSGGYGATARRALLDPAEPVRIRPLVRVEDRLALLQAMLEDKPDTTALLGDAAFRTKLMQLDWGGDPLFLMMAAMTMGEVDHARALALGRTDLATRLAEREAERFANLAREHRVDPDLAIHLAACVTLTQGMSRDEFERFAVAEKAAIHRPSGGDAAILADVLQEALPRADGIAPVLPDLIGEALIMRRLGNDAGTQTVLRCHVNSGHPVVASVIRCAQDFAPQVSAPLQWLEAITAALGNDEVAIAALADSLPRRSVVLRDFNLRVAQRLQELCFERKGASKGERAGTFLGLAIAQALAGKAEDAWRSGQKAVDLYRELITQQPDTYRPHLAMSLSNLANRFTELGQRESALRAAQDAVDLYRELATQQPDTYRPDLAMSLNNLAIMLSELGQRGTALYVAQEAVHLYRELAAQQPDEFQPNLAMSLGTLSNALSELGQREPALHAAQDAVDLYRKLDAQQPDVFRPDLALSLTNLANRLGEQGLHEPALHAAQEAVDLRRDLAAQRPDVFRSDLAGSLNNLAICLGKLGQRELALRAAQEAVDLCRELDAQRPDVFRPNLAMSLNNLAAMLSELRQREPALLAAQEAAGLYCELTVQWPDMFRPNLAASLNNLANRFGELGQHELALYAAQGATGLYRKLAAQRPDVFQPNLAMSLGTLAITLTELGQREPALRAAQEAVDLRRKLVAQRPDVFRPDLATSLFVLAFQMMAVRDTGSALSFAREAVATLLPEFKRHPNVHEGLMVAMVRDYVELCTSANQTPDQPLLDALLPYFTHKE